MSLGLENSKRSRHGALAKKGSFSLSSFEVISLPAPPHEICKAERGESGGGGSSGERFNPIWDGGEERYRPNLPHARARDARIFKRRPPPHPTHSQAAVLNDTSDAAAAACCMR